MEVRDCYIGSSGQLYIGGSTDPLHLGAVQGDGYFGGRSGIALVGLGNIRVGDRCHDCFLRDLFAGVGRVHFVRFTGKQHSGSGKCHRLDYREH